MAMTGHPGGLVPPSTALLTDLYELAMAAAYVGEGIAAEPATFSLFVRTLPDRYGYLVAAGLGDLLERLEELHFGPAEIDAVRSVGDWTDDFLDALAALRFTGSVRAVPEGRIVFPDEPLVEIEAPLVEAQLVETIALNRMTFQTVFATTCSRYLTAADGRRVVDFALRRAHGIDAGMKLVRAGRIVGLAATSNVAGGVRYGVPVQGTMAHSFVEAYEHEADAFRAFARRFRERTVLLVDTYDIQTGVGRAIEVASELARDGVRVAGIRIDSGDVAEEARRARRRLDAAGLDWMRIVVSGGLDEHEVDRLVREEQAPIDGFGVGSALGVSRGAPVLDSAYKLVALGDRPVRKTSEGKVTWPGAKQVWRAPHFDHDVLGLADEPSPVPGGEPLLVPVMEGGVRTGPGTDGLDAAHERFAAEWARLPSGVRHLTEPDPYEVQVSDRLRKVARGLDDERSG